MTPRRPIPAIFVAALVAGASFWPGRDLALPFWGFVLWKVAGLGLLALWAALAARSRDGWLIAAVLAFGTIGDVLLEFGRVAGGVAFLAGHLTAILLYRLNARGRGGVVGVAIALAVPVTADLLTRDLGTALYALGLGGMAGSAWASRFRRDRVALGALLFASSDLLIFAQDRLLAGSALPHLLIWPLYFGGQALIAYGVVTTLRCEDDDEDLYHRL
jgi:uncharacterized membrane protein YhhN